MQGGVRNKAGELLPIRELVKAQIVAALAESGGSKKRAAQALGISHKTLYNCLERYGLHVRTPRKFAHAGKNGDGV